MNDEKKFYCIMYSVWLLVAVAVWFCLSRIGLHSNGAGADSVGKQLGQAQQSAQTITTGIGQAEQSAGEARETARRIESIVVSTGDTIADSKRILAGIRQRGKIETSKN